MMLMPLNHVNLLVKQNVNKVLKAFKGRTLYWNAHIIELLRETYQKGPKPVIRVEHFIFGSFLV